mgnify:FL=1
MRITFFLFVSMLTNIVFAQHKIITLDLKTQDIKKKSLPFYIKDVKFENTVSDTVGLIETRKNNETILATFGNNKTKIVQNFLDNQYEQNKKGTPITLYIKKLTLSATKKGEFNYTDTFILSCTFNGMFENEMQTLYSFNAKNMFGTFEHADEVLANYITRALTSGIEKFKTSYELRKDWHQDYTGAKSENEKPIKTNISYNKINNTDSLACNSNYKLTWNDFQISKKESTDMGSARFILTYKVASEENNKQLKLDIYVNAFMNKNNSYKPKTIDEKWLMYQQGHFDICTAYGIKIYNEMKTFKYSLGEYKTELNKIYNDLYKEYVVLRKQYETETNIGSNEKENAKWRNKINVLLRENVKK